MIPSFVTILLLTLLTVLVAGTPHDVHHVIPVAPLFAEALPARGGLIAGPPLHVRWTDGPSRGGGRDRRGGVRLGVGGVGSSGTGGQRRGGPRRRRGWALLRRGMIGLRTSC